MPKIKILRLWCICIAAIAASYPLTVQAAIELQGRNLHAPFLWSWFGVWVFAAAGGIAAAFIRVKDIDNRIFLPFIGKPFIGTMASVSLCMFIGEGVEPPQAALTMWAFVVALCSTPIITGFLVFVSDQHRQNKLFSAAQDKFIPWSKKGGSDDTGNS